MRVERHPYLISKQGSKVRGTRPNQLILLFAIYDVYLVWDLGKLKRI